MYFCLSWACLPLKRTKHFLNLLCQLNVNKTWVDKFPSVCILASACQWYAHSKSALPALKESLSSGFGCVSVSVWVYSCISLVSCSSLMIRSVFTFSVARWGMFVSDCFCWHCNWAQAAWIPTSLPFCLQRYVENPSMMACYNELLQLEFGEVRSQLKLR